MSAQSDFKNNLKLMLMHYLAHVSGNQNKRNFMNEELEVRFKPNNQKFFGKTDYDNVISRLMGCNFKCNNTNGVNMLRIQSQYKTETGAIQMSNIRAELCGADLIQQYCNFDDNLNKIAAMPENAKKIKFTQKSSAKHEDKPIAKIENKDLGFNVSFNIESDYTINSKKSTEILSTWNTSQKTFRLINRIRFECVDSPIVVDLSILKTSKTTNGIMVPAYTLQESGLFNNPEYCEIELEINNSRVGVGTKYTNIDLIIQELQHVIRIVLGGIQGTKYPIPYSEQNGVINSYMNLISGEDYVPRRIMTRDFIGPNSCTLQLKNIVENEYSSEPSIRKNYCITDKADGERKLMYINKEGKVYLIDTNMRVQFSGSVVDRKEFAETIIDGEHIKYDRNKKYKNTYAAFDIYFLKGESVRNYNFLFDENEIPTAEALLKYRYPLLKITTEKMNKTMKSFLKDSSNDIEINTKLFYFPSKDVDIFKICSELLTKINDNTYLYETDGIIFTPINTGVGGTKSGQSSKMEKITWPLSFKWKPPSFNTIDFLVSYKLDKTGKEIIHNEFENGVNLSLKSVRQYRTLELKCGFNKKTHMILNPFQNMLDDNIPSSGDIDNEDSYIPVPFQPSLPYDPLACFANIYVETSETGVHMRTEEGETFENDTIVEFYYDKSKPSGWKWVPLRIRHDKTYDLRIGNRNYGNAYHVANDNWKSIHFPITEEMLKGQNIPEQDMSDEVYYNKSHNDTKNTLGLRNFHNLFVKKRLIAGVTKTDDILIDYAVGKGGDIPKWKQTNLKFVLGVDISKDNIYNQNDGVCARYLNERKQSKYLFDAMFLPGNSGLNIRDGSAFYNEKERTIAKSIFGSTKLNSELGKAVAKNHGIGRNGFNVSSCQFAIHYLFENKTVLHNFLRNVSECTKVGGYFIGTCYDGQSVFNKLKKNDNYSIYVDEKMIFDIQKKYNETGFPDDETSIGYSINVYQESINKYAVEYLVNFVYLTKLMGDYGFVLVNEDEAKTMGLTSGSGLFEDLFKLMIKEKNNKPYGDAAYMTREEKEISFLNRYFIFRKIHDVNSEKVVKIINIEQHHKEEFSEAVKEALKQPPMFIRKLKKKIVLNKYEPVEESKVLETENKKMVDAIIEENKLVDEENKMVDDKADAEALQEKKQRCKNGTKRFPALGPDCYTKEEIENRKTKKNK